MPRAVIFANGCVPDIETARGLLRPDDFLVAADGGAGHLSKLGLQPSLLVGDLDSLAEAAVQALELSGVQVLRFPRDKDATDLELALEAALEAGYSEITIAGGLGGRFDQSLGNLALLTRPELADIQVCLDDGLEAAFFVRKHAEVRGQPGEVVSLLPWGGPAGGVTTHGLRWPLCAETLYPDRTRGISNELVDESASVELASGLLLIIHRRHPQA